MHTYTRLPAALLATAAFLLAPAPGVDAKEPIVAYRGAVMTAIGGHTSALKEVITGKVPFDEDAKAHVLALGALAGMVDTLFPEGSGTGDSEALPAIWEKPAEFEKAVTNFQAKTADLVELADAKPAEMAGAFSEMGKSCKGCHDNFRKE